MRHPKVYIFSFGDFVDIAVPDNSFDYVVNTKHISSITADKLASGSLQVVIRTLCGHCAKFTLSPENYEDLLGAISKEDR